MATGGTSVSTVSTSNETGVVTNYDSFGIGDGYEGVTDTSNSDDNSGHSNSDPSNHDNDWSPE